MFFHSLHKNSYTLKLVCLKWNEITVRCIMCVQWIYQKALLIWFCQYLSFLNIFFNRFYPVENHYVNIYSLNIFLIDFCGVNLHLLMPWFIIKICSYIGEVQPKIEWLIQLFSTNGIVLKCLKVLKYW